MLNSIAGLGLLAAGIEGAATFHTITDVSEYWIAPFEPVKDTDLILRVRLKKQLMKWRFVAKLVMPGLVPGIHVLVALE
jgi:hypothetical protein